MIGRGVSRVTVIDRAMSSLQVSSLPSVNQSKSMSGSVAVKADDSVGGDGEREGQKV